MTGTWFRLGRATPQRPSLPKARSPGVRRAIGLSIFLLLSFRLLLPAQNSYDLSRFGSESGKFFTQPLRWEGSDWLKFGLLAGGTFLSMQADQPVRAAVLRNPGYDRSGVIEGGRIWGESYMTPSLAIAFELHGLATGNNTTKKIGFELGQAIIYSAVITQILSKSVGRARPNQNLGRASYRPFTYSGEDYHSFPGGHSSAAFVLSTVLSKNISSGFFKILVYAPAVVTVVSRIDQDYHWTSDDLLGAAIGYIVADWVVNQHDLMDDRIELTSIYPLGIRIRLN